MTSRTLPYRPGAPIAVELASGAVIFSARRNRVLLLHEAAEDRWGFPKGHVEPGESLRATAMREIAEETGLDRPELVSELGTVHYRFYDPTAGRNVLKIVVYFLGFSPQRKVTTEPIFDRWSWERRDRALTRLRFATDRRLLAAALRRVPDEHRTSRGPFLRGSSGRSDDDGHKRRTRGKSTRAANPGRSADGSIT